jgi:hypothetical protein
MRNKDKHVAMTLGRKRHPPPLERLVRVAVALCDDLMWEKSVLSPIGNPLQRNKCHVAVRYRLQGVGSWAFFNYLQGTPGSQSCTTT